jgi:hypothetical protein
MAEVLAYESTTRPHGAYDAALLQLLGAHAVPVWGWSEESAYAELAMAGPGLDHWVRTTNLWAEQERRAWEWAQLVGAVTDADPARVVTAAVGGLAADALAAVEAWIDIVFLAVCIDGLGEELVRTLTASTYAPLARHAKHLVMFKRGQCADGCNSLAEVVRESQIERAVVDERAAAWLDLARRFATRTTALESETGWVELGIAAALDTDGALTRVEHRLRAHLGEGP